jgi:hypothetical protein
MIQQIDELLAQYQTWLRDRMIVKEVGHWIEITTPYLDRHNDYLQIYARRNDDGIWELTDDGYIIADLESSGCNITSARRQAILLETINGFGVKRGTDNALIVKATEDNFPLKKHSLVQAMLAVGDMFQLSSANVASLFHEDVAKWMEESDIRYTRSVRLPGKSGYDQRFDFVIPPSKKSRHERFVNLINNPTKERAQSASFVWTDVRGSRPNAVAYTIINDAVAREVPQGVVEALRAYQIQPVLWSQRDAVREELAA